MGVDGFGSSIVIALAALLWLVYLVPTWFRRKEYLSTERNAVRLQQTLRIMAETAELPQQVRVETSARSAAAQEKLLRAQLRREDAAAKAQLAAAERAERQLAATLPALSADVASGSAASRRLRRSRALTSLVLLASFVAAGFGVAQLVAGSWLLLASAGVVAIGSFAMLGQLAAVSRARTELARGLRVPAPRVRTTVKLEEPPTPVQEDSSWTPVPVPKPLYLSRPQVDRAVEASLDAAAELREAAAASERRLREALSEPEVTSIVRPAVAPAPAVPSRFARMGYLEETTDATTDLDAVLQRRRASAAG
jgi:ABC-type multidrug transport system fused ATPase/permease subunit